MTYYSIICFQPDIDENTIQELIKLVRQGTKIYFFTFSPTEVLNSNEILADAKKSQLLFVYETVYKKEWENESFRYYNGEIPTDLLDMLASLAPFFNKEQYGIEHAVPGKNIMVSAGAGTGKTTAMINRVFYLKHILPDFKLSNIVLVTFTNKAAINMRGKLVAQVKNYFRLTKNPAYLKWLQEVKEMKIGTIHSFAYGMLDYYQEQVSEKTGVTVSQFRYRRKKIIEEVMDEFGEWQPEVFRRFKYIEQYKIIKVVETIIDQMSNLALSRERIGGMDFGVSEDKSDMLYEYLVKETVRRLAEYKEEKNFLDVSDLIIGLEKIMKLQSVKELPYDYIFIDEFQDTDKMQTKFFADLANRQAINLFVVGDVKQSIYRFRGADYTAFAQLAEITDVHETFHLQHNYRTDSLLIEKMNGMFSSWPELIPSFGFTDKDKLVPGRDSEGPVGTPLMNKSFTSFVDFNKFLKELENSNTAVLVRSNREVNELAERCRENKIYFLAEQDGDFFRSLPVREMYQLIHRFTHPKVWKNRYALHLSSYGERSLETDAIFRNFTAEKNFIQPMLDDVDAGLKRYEEMFQSRPVFEVLKTIIQEVNPAFNHAQRFLEEKYRLYEEDFENIKAQAEVMMKEYQLNLDQLIHLLKKECKGTVPTLSRLEKMLGLKMTIDRSASSIYMEGDQKNRLTIMTVHKAKGLEFDYVFLPYTKNPFDKFASTDIIIDGNRLGYQATIEKRKTHTNDFYEQFHKQEKSENAGEEARLLYVAMTRAKKGVYIDAPEQANSHLMKNWGDLYARSHQKTEKSIILS